MCFLLRVDLNDRTSPDFMPENSIPVLLVLLTSLAWAALDAERKWLSQHISPLRLSFYLSISLVPFVMPGVLVNLELPNSWAYWAPALVSAMLSAAGSYLLIKSISLGPLGETIPLLSFTAVISSIVGWVVLGENLSALKWAGIGLVLVGALTLQTSPRRSLSDYFLALGNNRAAQLMFLAASAWGVSISFDKMALSHASIQFHLLVIASFASITFGLALKGNIKPTSYKLSEVSFMLALSVLTCAVALFAQLQAIKYVEVGVVESVKRGFSVFGAVINGRLFFSEQLTVKKCLSAFSLFLGVLILLLS